MRKQKETTMNYRTLFSSGLILALAATQTALPAAAHLSKKHRICYFGIPGATPLYLTALHGDLPELQRMLAQPGVDVNIQNRDSLATPLSGAIYRKDGDLSHARALLLAHADPHIANSDGYTSLHRAAMDNNPQACQFLVAYGANIGIKDNKNNTPEELADTVLSTDAAEYLESVRIERTITELQALPYFPEVGLSNIIASYLTRKR